MRRRWCGTLALLVLALLSSGCSIVEQALSLLSPPTPALVVTVTQGQVRDAITGRPLSAVQLRSAAVTALSDVQGAFSVPALTDGTIQISAPGYETAEIRPRPGFPLIVDLVPNAAATFSILYGYERQHEFGRQYDLLHPDVQTLFSRDEYIRYMEQYRPYELVSYTVGDANTIVSGNMLGKVYTDVQQVPVQATVRVNGQLKQQGWLGYAVKLDGLWRWLRGPLIWPTPAPTPAPSLTAIPTWPPLPTSTSTSYSILAPSPTAVQAWPTPSLPTPAIASPSEERVAFISDRDGNADVYVMRADGTGLQNLTEHAARDDGPSWAPTHDRLAFVSDREGNNDIFLVNADGSGLSRLTSRLSDELDPAWSPNGAFIAYVSNQDGDWEVFLTGANGSGTVQLTRNDVWDSEPCWSPDSLKLAYTSERDGNYDLYMYDLTTHTEKRLTNHTASDTSPAWSPGGTEMAFTSARDGWPEVYVLELTSVPQRLTRLTYGTDGQAASGYATWSSDGLWLAFASWRDVNAEIYVIRRDGWGLRNLTAHSADDESPAWAY